MIRATLSAALLLTTGAIAQCTITAPGTQITPVPFDAWTPIQTLGITFPFCGTNYTDCYITDHGFLALTNGGTPAAPPINNWLYDPQTVKLIGGYPLIMPNWIDSWPTTNYVPTDATIWIDNASGTHCTITFVDHEEYLSNGTPGTTQVTLYPDGRIIFCIDNRVDNSGSTWASPEALTAIFGVTPGTGVLPAQVDVSSSPITADNICHQSWQTSAPNTPNPLYDIKNSTITLIPTNPGWIVLFDTLACASNTTYGSGCHGLGVSSNNPVLGQLWNITTTGVHPISPVAFVFFGAGRQDPGLPLSVLGVNAPGCLLNLAGLVADASAPAAAGTSTLSIYVPFIATLKDASFTFQSAALVPFNPDGVATSNGGEAFIGY